MADPLIPNVPVAYKSWKEMARRVAASLNQVIGRHERWDDIRTPANAFHPSTSPPGEINFITSALRVYGFDAASTEQLFFAVQLPHSYKEGSNIHAHVHWTPTDSGTGTVKWQLDYSFQNIDGTFTTATAAAALATATGTPWHHAMSEIVEIDGTGKKISAMLIGRLARIGGDASDTYAADAALLELDFHYQLDSIGSTEEYVK